MTDAPHDLDNPVWHALTGPQADFANGDDRARRYQSTVAPFGAVADNSAASFEHLAATIAPGGTVALVGSALPADQKWTQVRGLTVVQMVYDGPSVQPVEGQAAITPLTAANVPAMLELVERTHPGPFMERTIELGRYYGIWQDGRLAAMAGERMHVRGYREISAVCTHPDFQRRGYAGQLIARLIHDIQSDGDIPFLHVISENHSALVLYEKLSFKKRAELPLRIFQRAA